MTQTLGRCSAESAVGEALKALSPSSCEPMVKLSFSESCFPNSQRVAMKPGGIIMGLNEPPVSRMLLRMYQVLYYSSYHSFPFLFT
jgi:hypothetical protein